MIAVARIIRSVGLKGEVAVSVLGDRPERLNELGTVEVGSTAELTETRSIESVEARNGRTVVKLAGIRTRTEADALRGLWLFVEESRTAKLPDGSYYVHDIVGMNVVSDEGRKLGTLKDVLNLPGGDLWVVQTDGGEAMIPAVREFVKTVDLAEGRIVVHMIEGLVE